MSARIEQLQRGESRPAERGRRDGREDGRERRLCPNRERLSGAVVDCFADELHGTWKRFGHITEARQLSGDAVVAEAPEDPGPRPGGGGGHPKCLFARAMRVPAGGERFAGELEPGKPAKVGSRVCAGCERAHREPDLRRRDGGERDICLTERLAAHHLDRADKPLARERGDREGCGAHPVGHPQHRLGRKAVGHTIRRSAGTGHLGGERRCLGRNRTGDESAVVPENPDRNELRAERLGRTGRDRGERRPQLTPRRDLLGRFGKRLDRRPLGSDGHQKEILP